ncbi:unnamed protein product [Caenorhabditis sp. 36 PRJEB53466]|nr:unnamed protein product [Caenorhabditis sp. 36 PRJEB53466]
MCTPQEQQLLKDNYLAVQQLDAFGKFPSAGVLEINTLYDGNYQECERVGGHKKYSTNYCYLNLRLGKNAQCSATSILSLISIRLAVCFPESCQPNDLVTIFNSLSAVPFTACSASCARFPVARDSAFWGFSIFLIVIASLVLFASLVDFIRELALGISSGKERNQSLQLLYSFSIWTNAGQILSVKEHKVGFIKSLDSIRALSIMWVVTGHSFTYLLATDTLLPLANFTKHFWNHLVLSAFISVDTFFLLSGIVVSYLFFKTRPDSKTLTSPITWILFYLHRYLRLTPPIMIFIGFFAVYGYHIQGPLAASQQNSFYSQCDVCKTNWWQNLLYINNFIEGANQCYSITWYLAVDTQLYLVAPIVLVAFYFSHILGALLVLSGLIGSIITAYVLYGTYDLPADALSGDQNAFGIYLYTKPWIRCIPYLVGMLTGYFLAAYGKRKIRLHWILAVFGWIIAFGIGAACIFTTYDYDKGSYWNTFDKATYFNFSRLLWAVAVSWVIVANHMGWGGPIDAFMSHPVWQPFGRLSYCTYIVHWMVLFWYLNIGQTPFHYANSWQVFLYYAMPVTILSFVFAFFWSCLFEIPILKLEKMLIGALMGRRKHSVEKKDSFVLTQHPI